jgi:hypothetical protein
VKSYEVRLYTHNGALREIETSQEKSETLFWRSYCVDKTAVTFLIFIASKLTNEVPFERRKIYLSTDYNIMIPQKYVVTT